MCTACWVPHWLAVLVLEALYLSVHKEKRHDMFLGNCDPCVSILKAHRTPLFLAIRWLDLWKNANKEEKCPTLSKNLHRYQELPYFKGDTSKGDASSKSSSQCSLLDVCLMQTWLLLGSPRLALLVSQPPMTPLENKDYLRARWEEVKPVNKWKYRLIKNGATVLGKTPGHVTYSLGLFFNGKIQLIANLGGYHYFG